VSPLARRAADAALSVAGAVLWTVGLALAVWCLVVDAPTGTEQRAALAALWSTVTAP
jgi:hypothetical protein